MPEGQFRPWRSFRIPGYILLASLLVFASHFVFDFLVGDSPAHRRYETLADALVAFPTTLLVFSLLRREMLARHRVEAARQAIEHRLAVTLQTAAEAIIGVDPDDRIYLFNREAERIFGYPSGEVQGSSIEGIIMDGLRSLLPAPSAWGPLPADADLKTPRLRMTGLRKDGTSFPAEGTASPLVENGRTFITLVLQDISRRRRAEDALRQYQQQLEERVHERTKELIWRGTNSLEY